MHQQANLLKPGQWWISELHPSGLLGLRVVLKTELTHFAGGGAKQTVALVGQRSCCLMKTTAQNTLHELAASHLRPHLQPNLWTERTKYYSQASHLVKSHQSTHL
jgi:hypothetical protein